MVVVTVAVVTMDAEVGFGSSFSFAAAAVMVLVAVIASAAKNEHKTWARSFMDRALFSSVNGFGCFPDLASYTGPGCRFPLRDYVSVFSSYTHHLFRIPNYHL